MDTKELFDAPPKECTASDGNNWSGGHALTHSIALVLSVHPAASSKLPACSTADLLALRCNGISPQLHARQQQAADVQ